MATPPATGGAPASIEEAIVTIVRVATLASTHERVAAEAGVPLERSGYGVLRAVAEDGPLPVSALARRLGLDPSTASRHVAGLERGGLLARSGDRSDRRVATVALTGAGRRALQRLRAARHRFFAEVLAEWPPSDVDALAPLLARLAADFVANGARP
jgi:DNA-binding MarR family transcriptional regulator